MAKHFLSDRDVEFQRGINRTVRQLQPETVRPNSYHRAETGSAAAVPNEYMGYFKLYLISETSGGTTTYKVRIADGATYQSESNVGGNSTCKVNNMTFSVAPYLSGSLIANMLFYLKYNASAATVTLESSATLLIPGDTDTEAYYQLGRFYSGTAPYVAQDHSNVTTIYGTGSTTPTVVANGIPQIWRVKNEC